jgi:acyl homoserine lactone synthase
MTEISVIRMTEKNSRYDLVKSFLELRKNVFVDKKQWALEHFDRIEFEQYDTFYAVYVIAHEGSQVVGGARLLPTNHIIGSGRV